MALRCGKLLCLALAASFFVVCLVRQLATPVGLLQEKACMLIARRCFVVLSTGC